MSVFTARKHGPNSTLFAVYGLLLDGCWSPPYVENATAEFDQLNGSVSLTCVKGHRFPNGEQHLVVSCNQDTSWPLIDHCQGTSMYTVVPL